MSKEILQLHNSLIDLVGFMNRPQRDTALIQEAGISLDRALFPLLMGIQRHGPIGVVELAELAGRGADGVNLPGGPGLPRLLAVAQAARTAAGQDWSSFVVTVSSDVGAAALDRLAALGVTRAVAFVRPPFAARVRRLALSRR